MPNDPLVGLTVEQALGVCGAAFEDTLPIDEPPGKLRGLRVDCRDGDEVRRLVLAFDYDIDLFSETRDWPREIVLARRVTAVRDASSTGSSHS